MDPAEKYDLDELLGRFENAWRNGLAPRLEEFLPATTAQERREILTELIKVDLEYRWCARLPGQARPADSVAAVDRTRLEDYVARFPDLGPVERLPAELIAEEYRVRHWAGDQPTHREFMERFGARSAELGPLLAQIDEELASESRPSQPVAPLSRLPETVLPVAEPLPSAEELLTVLSATRLLHPDQLATLHRDPHRFTDARELGRHLLDQGWLTAYQVNQLLLGRGTDLVLGPYLVLERLGDSFKGQVFKAHHQRMNRLVGLKVIRRELLAEPETVRRFYREVQAAGRISHVHVVHAFDAGPVGGTHLLAMEFVDGIDLGALVKRSGALSATLACDYVRQAALGLQAIHDHGLVHRDIKPSNLIVTMTDPEGIGPSGLVKILDLGLALLQRPVDPDVTETLTQEGAVMGTPDFMAPEQAEDPHRVDIRADLYSLGCTLYYLLTAQLPFPGTSLLQKLDRHRWQEPMPVEQLRPDLPPGAAAVVRTLMAKRPEDRYQQPAQLAAALAEVMGNGDPTGRTAILPPPRRSAGVIPFAKPVAAPIRSSRRRWLLRAAGVALVPLIGFLLFHYFSNPTLDNDRPAPTPTPTPREFPRSLLVLDRLNKVPLEEQIPGQPRELVAVLGEHRWRHWTPVNTVAFSPDGKIVASGSNDLVIRLDWTDPAAKRAVLLQGHTGPVRSLAFSPDGRLLASASEDRTVVLWDVASATRLNTLHGHEYSVLAVAFTPDGKTVVSGGTDKVVKLWDVAAPRSTKKERASLPHPAAVNSLAVSVGPDGRQTLAAGSGGGILKLWDLADGKERASISAHRDNVAALAFSPDGATLASSGWDLSIKLWDVAAATQQGTLSLSKGQGAYRTYALAFAPDGKMLAVGRNDRNVDLWDVTSGKVIRSLKGHVDAVSSLAFSRDGLLASGGMDHAVKLWNVSAGKERFSWQGHASRVKSIAFTRDGHTLVSVADDKTMKLWDLAQLKVRRTLTLEGDRPQLVALAPDDRTLAWAVGTGAGQVGLGDVASGTVRHTIPGSAFERFALAFSPDSKTLASVGEHYNRSIRLTDVDSGRARTLPNLPKDSAIRVLAYAPDGTALASGGTDKTVRLWDLATAKATTVGEHATRVVFVTYADSQTLVSASEDRAVKVWDLGAASEQRFFHVDQIDTLTSAAAALAPDGTSLVFGGKNRQLVQRSLTGATLRQVTLPGPIDCLAFAADGRHLAVGNANGTIYVLRLAPPPATGRLAE